MTLGVLSLLAFLCGSLMFSAWLPRLRGRDTGQVGDGNPGAVNAFKAAGPVIGTVALLLDFLKGAVPVAVAHWGMHLHGWHLAPIAVAPVAGHAFSPFLGFRGGKAVAVTFGVWSGLTGWEAPCVLGAACLAGKFALRIDRDAWVVMLGLLALLGYVLLRRPDPAAGVIWAANAALLVTRHWRELWRR